MTKTRRMLMKNHSSFILWLGLVMLNVQNLRNLCFHVTCVVLLLMLISLFENFKNSVLCKIHTCETLPYKCVIGKNHVPGLHVENN